MKISISLFFTLILLQTTLLAQSRTMSIYAEGGGYSRFYSLGWEQEVLSTDTWATAIRLGIGGQNQALYVPGRLQLYSLGQRHRIQGSLGATFLQDRTKANNPDIFLFLGAGIGYRLQLPGERVWLQLGYVQLLQTDPTATQLIDPEPVWRPSFECSLGWKIRG